MLDPTTFRSVLGRVASGVSVITTVTADGRDHGMTATALCSLSLDPPLILICVDRAATIHPHLAPAAKFAVSLLAREQEPLSRRFAETRDDRFDGVAYTRALTGCALVTDALAHLECTMWAQYAGGDHTIFVGHVVRAVARDAAPLLYYRGGYAALDT